MLIVADNLFVTQIARRARARSLRGAVPTVISASLALVTASKALTESLSWFTTQMRLLLPERGSKAMLLEFVGRLAVAGR